MAEASLSADATACSPRASPAPSFAEFWAPAKSMLPQLPLDGGTLRAFRDDPGHAAADHQRQDRDHFSRRSPASVTTTAPAIRPGWDATNVPDATNPLQLVANQPASRLHSQLDFGGHSSAAKHRGREVARMHPVDAAMRAASRTATSSSCSTSAAPASPRWCHRRRHGRRGAAADRRLLRSRGSERGQAALRARQSERADPGCRHLALAQGCTGQLTVVQVERFTGNLPPIQAYDPPVPVIWPRPPKLEAAE
jgi:biotin/methionine sulfoxide reductase